ncbi:MAG: tyrosine-type recombinase/integrase [Desulfobulbaceae bacterium]|nr:tyrosine-type recombinase/integrase [Desulfobulbaceae bacterium]
MTEVNSPENLFKCRRVKFDPLPLHQNLSTSFVVHQAQQDCNSQYFSQSVSPDGHEITEKRRMLDHMTQRLVSSRLPGTDSAIEYLQHKYRNNLATNTIKKAGSATLSFLKFLMKSGVNNIKDLSRQNIYAYVEAAQNRGLKVGAIKSDLMAVYTFLRFLVDQEILEPAILDKKIQLKLPKLLPRAIPSEDIEALLALISDVRDRAMILVLLRTGMRIGELLNVKVGDIILPERKILIYLGEKNYQGRVVYFTEDADKILRRWLSERKVNNEYLFYGYSGGKLSYAGARKRLRKYLIAAGLEHKGYGLHSLRHTFATDLLNAGLRLEVLQQLLGHLCIEMTQRYARLSDLTREAEYFKAMGIIEQGGRSHGTHRINFELQAVFEEKKLVRSHG